MLLSYPVYTSYHVGSVPASDQTIVEKFVNRCSVVNMPFVLYFNIGKDLNIRRWVSEIDGPFDETDTFNIQYEIYVEKAKAEIAYIVSTYSPDYVWLDADQFYPMFYGQDITARRYYQDIYNAIKEVDPTCLIIANYSMPDPDTTIVPNGNFPTRPWYDFNGTELLIFPIDIIGLEETRKATDVNQYNPVTTHKTIDDYMPREITDSILTNGFFWADGTNSTLKTLVNLQASYDFAQDQSTPYSLNIGIDTNGIAPSNQLTRYRQIVL